MRRVAIYMTLGALAVTVSACGGEEPEPQQVTAVPVTPAGTATPDEAPAGTPNTPDMVAGPGAGAAVSDGLVGTAWQVEGVYVEFRDEDTVFLRGGPLASLAPDGIETRYVLKEDGTLETTIVGVTRTGQWDGETLTIDGSVAELQ